MVPQFVKAFGSSPQIVKGNKVLVIVQLTGGNDGLNTIIPYRNDIYYRNRPFLGIARTAAIPLTDDVGLTTGMKNLKRLYDDGKVSIVNGVGYEHPTRSHFRSMDIWQTGSRADEFITSGWIGRYLDHSCAGCDKHYSMAIEVDDALALAMRGKAKNAIAIKNIEQFYNAASDPFFKKLTAHQQEHHAQLAGYLYKSLRETTSAAEYIHAQTKIYNTQAAYPSTDLGQRMKTIGSLIISNAETRVYYASLASFDTHVGQKERQIHLLEQVDTAIAALVDDLKTNNRFDDVLIMVFSEFGRRVVQNASNGTDHGAANSMFFISGGIKKAGLYNNIPSLENLDEGDLRYEIDFKSAYAMVLDNWLKVNSKEILGREYKPLDVV